MHKTALALLALACAGLACTNFIVTPGASTSGASTISYAADSAQLYGALYHKAHATHAPGTMMDIVDWDTGVYLGQIEQVEETYNTVGNTNEYGLAIGETTFGGLAELAQQDGAIMDYGSLIYVTLQRAKTAREAITVMTDLVAKYGYASSGESFTIADNKEVWVLEMIGKGNYERGAVWVARRVPDGHVTAHANQARITTFPHNDLENYRFSADVVSFAKEHGFYPKTASDADFSFSDVYAPLTFDGARLCEMRVWSFFRSVVGADELDQYADYASGWNLTHRMPWSFAPARKLSAADVMELMKDHLEGTRFDFTQDVGAGAYNLPYRWRPMDFESGGKRYTNERSTSTQQTGFVFVAELRPGLPEPLIAKNWFGVDDAACTVFAPMYGSNTEVPVALAEEGHGAIMNFTFDSSFWVFNLVANLAYTRWRIIYPEVQDFAKRLQAQYIVDSAEAEQRARTLWEAGQQDEAVQHLTKFSTTTAQSLHDVWLDFWEYLVPRHLDGDLKTYVPGEQNPNVETPGYGDAWYARIANETGSKYLIPDENDQSSSSHAAIAEPVVAAVLRTLVSFYQAW